MEEVKEEDEEDNDVNCNECSRNKHILFFS